MASVDHSCNAARKRLLMDLKDCQESAVPGISAVPLEDNMFEWHCNILSSDLPVHVILYIPKDYPLSAPSAEFLPYGLSNPYGASLAGNKGEIFCMSIVSDFESYHPEWKHEEGYNWSPAYTIQTVLLNIAAYLSQDDRLVTRSDNRNLITDPELKCADCGHTTVTPFPPLPASETLDSASPSTSGHSRKPQITCYISRETFDPSQTPTCCDELFGVGLNCHGPTKRPFWSSPCETLKLKAFKNMKELQGKVLSSSNEEVYHFLPLMLHSRQGESIKEEFESTMKSMHQEKRYTGRETPTMDSIILESLPNLMATTLEDFSGALKGSGTLLTGFFLFHRLFLWAIETYGLQDAIDQKIEEFISNPSSRCKKRCPYPEEWLMLLSVSSKYRWLDVAGVYMDELRKRDVLEAIRKDASLGDPDKDISFVIKNTFDLSRKEKQTLAIQVAFVTSASPAGLKGSDVICRYDNNLSSPTSDMEMKIRETLNLSHDMKTFSDWYKILNLEPPSEEMMMKQLMEAVEYAASTDGYHCVRPGKANGWKRFMINRKARKAADAKRKRQQKVNDIREHLLNCENTGFSAASCNMENEINKLKKSVSETVTRRAFGMQEPMDTDQKDSKLPEEQFMKPNFRRLSERRIAYLKEKRHFELAQRNIHVGRPRRMQSCLCF